MGKNLLKVFDKNKRGKKKSKFNYNTVSNQVFISLDVHCQHVLK